MNMQLHKQVEMTYRSHNNAAASTGKSGEGGYRCWRNATGSRGAVKGKRVGLELGRCNRAPLYRMQGLRDSLFSVLLIWDRSNCIRGKGYCYCYCYCAAICKWSRKGD
jgi:hypothetical protein